MYIQTPYLNTIANPDGSKTNIVSLSYAFQTDPVSQINLGGFTGPGCAFPIDLGSLGGSANLPAMRSMMFSCTFLGSNSQSIFDGELVISIPSTGQLIRFGPGSSYSGNADTQYVGVLNACIPILSNAPSKLIIAKAADSSNVNVQGIFNATLFDCDIAPFSSFGFCGN